MTSQPPPSHSLHEHAVYLLRVWHEPGDAGPVWRASLQLPGGGPRRHFTAPGPLLACLATTLAESGNTPGAQRFDG